MEDNPLKRFFRQPALYLRLPTDARWYRPDEVSPNESGEIAIYGLSAIDDIMLNTPDAMLNGQALEHVIGNCAPEIKKAKTLMVPDLEAVFLAIKIATTGSKHEMDKSCPNCKHENHFEMNCDYLLSTMKYIEPSEARLLIGDDLEVHSKPYTLEMRQLFVQRQLEEDRLLKKIDAENKDLDDIQKARILSESVEKLTRITIDLVSRSIDKIVLVKEGITVTDQRQISEWLTNITKTQSELILETINALNDAGPQKVMKARCEKCNHEWEEQISFDPVSFFARYSVPRTLT